MLRKKKNMLLIGLIVLSCICSICVLKQKKGVKAESYNYKSENVIVNEEIDEYIELLRKMNEEISIYNVDELYNNLEQINDLTKDDVQKELARSSDEVIYKFLQNENTNAREVLEKISNLHENTNISIPSEDKDYLSEIKVENYILGDATKTVVKTETKYGTEIECELIDEPEGMDIVRGSWKKTNDWSETVTKSYGKRRFTYTEKSGGISGFKEAYSRFGYTVSDDGLSARYIKGKGQSKWYGQYLTVIEEKITDGVAKSIGSNIDGYVLFDTAYTNVNQYGQIKTNMAVKIKSWNKTKKKMVVEHHVAKYKK